MKINKNMVYARTSHNRSVYASPPVGGSGYAKMQSGLRPLCIFAPPHFFAPVKCFAFSLSGAKKRHIPPERYIPDEKLDFCQIFPEND
jgi:hypothetical protein